MKSFKTKKKSSIIKTYIIIILIETITIINILSKRISPKITNILKSNINTYNKEIISKYINSNLLTTINLNKLIEIVKNKNDEIISINYNMNEVYSLMNKIESNIEELKETTSYEEYDEYAKILKNKVIVRYPIGISSNNIFLNNIGSKIPLILYIDKNIVLNIKTKVTNYGINNSLIELYLNTKVSSNIISTYKVEEIENEYNILLMSKIIVGSIPNYLNNSIEKEITNEI